MIVQISTGNPQNISSETRTYPGNLLHWYREMNKPVSDDKYTHKP